MKVLNHIACSVALLFCSELSAQSGPCAPTWIPTFGAEPGADDDVRDFVRFDDGTGEALYMGGDFSGVGGDAVRGLAKWDGTHWQPVGGGLDGDVYALHVHDDGAGAALYVSGNFQSAGGTAVNGLAKWNGSSWSSLGGGVDIGFVTAFTTFQTVGGPLLIAGGAFNQMDGVSANSIASYDGTQWSSIGTGAGNTVQALEAFDDGTGYALYAGVVSSPGVRRWNGSNWSTVGGGLSGYQGNVRALTVYDDGTGAKLYAAGLFTFFGTTGGASVAVWDGTNWREVGASPVFTGTDFTVFDDGNGPRLYVSGGGTFVIYAGPSKIARLDGTTWSSVALLDDDVTAIDTIEVGGGDRLIAGGHFETDDSTGRQLGGLSFHDGSEWQAFGTGLSAIVINCQAVFDDGSGPALYIGGMFDEGSGMPLGDIAKWDGMQFTSVAGGVSGGPVQSFHVYDDGGGDALYVGGYFTSAGGAPFERIARFDGTSWSGVGAGFNGGVLAIEDYDDGTGRKLVVAGEFNASGSTPLSGPAAFDGTNWVQLGSGLVFISSVQTLLVDSSGAGDTLYAGGRFGAFASPNVAAFDGTAWNPLGSGLGGAQFSIVSALEFFDDGTGRALYAAGIFASSGGATVRGVGRFNGASWLNVGGGLTSISGMGTSGSDAYVQALEVHDDGTGEALYAGGTFHLAGGNPANRLARFDGNGWVGLPNSMAAVTSLHSFAGFGGPSLYVGGQFFNVASGDSHMARWGGCAGGDLNAFCFGDGGTSPGCTACPCNNDAAPGSGGGCINADGRSAVLLASGATVTLADTLRFEVNGAASSTFGLLISADNQLPAMGSCPVGSGIVAFDGLRCAGGAFLRHGSRATDSNGDMGQSTPGWGPPDGPMGGLIASSGFTSGQMRHFQVFYRDNLNASCGTGQNSTNAVSVTFR